MIIRTEKTANYTILSNDFLLDENISDKARGLLARLLARPDDWNLNVNHLVKTGKAGHSATRSAIKELESAGYIQKEVTRQENGRIIGVEYIIYESPVKSCGDRPAADHRRVVDPEQETNAQEIHIQDTGIIENHMTETVIKETAPITNTDIKQRLKVTTTTPAREAEPVVCDQVLPSSSCTSHEILNLIPEKHRSPIVVTFVNKAVVDYPVSEVEQALAYAGAYVRGGDFQFKAYLDKTLKNKWAEGYLDSMNEQRAKGFSWDQIDFRHGFVTGSRRMDSNLAACLDFVAESIGEEVMV